MAYDKYIEGIRTNFDVVLYSRKPNTRDWMMLINYTDVGGHWQVVRYSHILMTKTQIQYVMASDRHIGLKPKVVGHKKFTAIHKALGAIKAR